MDIVNVFEEVMSAKSQSANGNVTRHTDDFTDVDLSHAVTRIITFTF